MCGIAGLIYKNSMTEEAVGRISSNILEAISHRGPDDKGNWHSAEDRVLLLHRRLSILDLSPAGAQPMTSRDARYVIVYNGEVYNAPDLRPEFEASGIVFRGHSDTEVILEMIARYGVENSIKRFNGMFAFAVWDSLDKKLYFARDRFGIKPLYYGWAKDGSFLFGSELKALTQWPDFDATLDMNSLGQYFRHNYIPGSLSVYKNVKKLLPGHMMIIDATDFSCGREKISSFWDPVSIFNSRSHARNGKVDENEAMEKLDSLLFDSVKMRMLSDVPLGAFLSGGVDSSTVVSMMCKANPGKVKTFSIGFAEDAFNESHYAKAVAQHLGTDHTELFVTAKEAQDFIPEIPSIWDEPFADSSQIPTFFLSKLTRQHVTVSLSGDGGDELFHGYPRYNMAEDFRGRYDKIPAPLKKLSSLLRKSPPALLDKIDRITCPLLSSVAKPKYNCSLFLRALELLSPPSATEFYGWLISHQVPAGGIMNGYDAIADIFMKDHLVETNKLIDIFSILDMKSYLPDDILVKVDRASMAVSLEARTPLLDYRLAEFALSLPHEIKSGKRILRNVLFKYVPQYLIERPKMGFGIPLGEWLAGPLRDWGESLLSEDALRKHDILNRRNVRKLWKEHIDGTFNHQYILWNILMFQAWLEKH